MVDEGRLVVFEVDADGRVGEILEVPDRRHRLRLEDRLYLARLGGRLDDDEHGEPRSVMTSLVDRSGTGP